jgi:hypothetical protein
VSTGSIVSNFAQAGLLYEDAEYHNAVFIGKDDHGASRHAHKRSVNSEGKVFRMNVEGSDPRYSFHWTGVSDRLYVFEAPIDLMSFISLYQNCKPTATPRSAALLNMPCSGCWSRINR